MEHESPEALKRYLKEHPDADKSKHHVKKQEGSGSKGAPANVAIMSKKPARPIFQGISSIKNESQGAQKATDKLIDKSLESGTLSDPGKTLKAVADSYGKQYDQAKDMSKGLQELANKVKTLYGNADFDPPEPVVKALKGAKKSLDDIQEHADVLAGDFDSMDHDKANDALRKVKDGDNSTHEALQKAYLDFRAHMTKVYEVLNANTKM
jgi:hypothetical protein